MKTTRKLFAMVLCLCMVLSCVPAFQVSADETVSNENFEIFGANSMPKGWSITSLANSGLVEIGGDYDQNYTFGIVEETDGNKAIAINKNATGYAALTTPAIPMEAGASYNLSFDYRTSATGVINGAEEMIEFWGMNASVHFFDANGEELAGTYKRLTPKVVGATVTDAWTTVSYSFVAVEGTASAKVLFGLGGQKYATAQMLFDNIKVVSSSANELTNGNFDNVVYEADGGRTADVAGPWGWKQISSNGDGQNIVGQNEAYTKEFVSSVVEENGNKVLKMEPADSNPYGYAVLHSSYIEAQPTTHYAVTYDRKIENGENANANYPARTLIHYYDAEKNLIGNNRYNASAASQDWTEVQHIIKTPADTAYFTVGYFIGFTTTGYAYYYDNVSVSALADCFNEDFELVDSSNVPYNWGKASLSSSACTTVGSNWAGNYSIGTVDLGNGEKAVSFNKNGIGYAALTSPAVDVKEDAKYLLTFDYRTAALGFKEGTTDKGSFFGLMTTVHFYNENGEELTDAFLKVTSTQVAKEVSESWTTTTYEFTVPADAVSAKVFFGMGGEMNCTAQMLFKNVSVVGNDNDTVINSAFDHIVYEADGGRAADVAGPWGWNVIASGGDGMNIIDQEPKYELEYIASVVEENGNNVLKMTPADSNPYGYVVVQSAPIKVKPSTPYGISFDRKIENGENANYPTRTLFHYYDADMNIIGKHRVDATMVSHDWTEIHQRFFTPANTAYVTVGFYIGGTKTNYAYYYDNVKLGAPVYTVQYVVDGEVIEQYSVERGGDVPAIVPVPEKEGHIGAWSHDGLNITGDTVITANYTSLASYPLWAKSVLFTGDAICAASDNAGWAGRIGEKYNMTYVNAGVSGASVSTVRTSRIVDQLKNNKANDFDFVILHGGTNDAWSEAPIGEITDSYALSAFDADTFAGGLEELFYYAKLYYGDAKFGYIINFRFSSSNPNGYLADMTEYVEMTKAICEKWDIPYLDLYNNEELNAALNADSLDNFSDKTYSVHPNAAGYEIITPYIEAWMNDVVATHEATAIPVANNVEKWNITLRDNIGANFYVTAADAEQTTVKVTIAGEENTFALSNKNDDGYYVISVDTAAAQMTDEIQVEMIVNGEVVKTGTYSVYTYAQYILSGEYSAETKALVKEMLNYGAAAQNYFSYNTENKIDETLIADAGASEIDGSNVADMVIEGSADGIHFYGASLVFDSKVAVRFYFTVEGDISNYTFSAGSEPVLKNGMYYVEIADINPQDYDEAITLTVNETLTISYSPMNYIVRKGANGSDNLKALLKAMYNYYLAAEAYTA